VAVNGSDAGEAVVFIQSESIFPVNEGFLDSLAFGVGADGAEAFVTLGIDGGARGGLAPGSSALVQVGSPLGAKSAPTDANTGGGGEILKWSGKEFSGTISVGTGSTGVGRERKSRAAALRISG
jgi:hypothetical protein